MNENIKSFLDIYLENPDPDYAVMINGDWGCGKTFFVKQWLKAYNEPEAGDDQITLKPIFVSLYGVSEEKQITEAIDRKLHPLIYSKGARYAKKFFNLLGKVILRTDLDIDGDNKDDATLSFSLDSLSVFESENNMISGTKFLVFDDLERCLIEPKHLLGYLNNFVEHCHCHVVVIGDEDKLNETYKEQLNTFKEKTIGREFKLKADVNSAVDYFLDDDLLVCDWLKGQRAFVIEVFKATQTINLRILRQCLYDFDVQFRQLDNELVSKDTYVLKQLLASYIVVYCEYKGKNRELMKKWQNSYGSGLVFGNSNSQKDEIMQLQTKYKTLNVSLNYDVLHAGYIYTIVHQIEEGNSIKKDVEDILRDSQIKEGALEKLTKFFNLSNEDFDKECNIVQQNLVENKYENMYQSGRAIAMMVFFDNKGMYWLNSATLSLIKVYLQQRFSTIPDKPELYKERKAFIQGIQSYGAIYQMPIGRDIIDYFNEQFKQTVDNLPDEMDVALNNLSDENINTLVDLDNSTIPDGHCNYENTSIFANIDPDVLYERIKGLSNAGRMEFAGFLSYHYKVGCLMSSTECFSKDIDCLLVVREKVQKMENTTRSVKKWSYAYLLKYIDAGIARVNGETGGLIS